MTNRANPALLLGALAVALLAVVGAGLALGTVDTQPSKAELHAGQPDRK
ncbi:hypothetical protein [Allokutzneria albata]|uniref:Uncharacterized protein n=1 Tax=Allokutzneria albata TaxID=211114 RepID=A0A1G9Z7P2_ALLAB|nr:hypothetical protein [Allokutzneria albata]SDN17608.1 hypothetical protein SAMN04489726_5342 [Allokutzneria albata]